MHITSSTPPDKYPWMKTYVIAMTFFIWSYGVLKLRVVSVQLAVFVSGFINVSVCVFLMSECVINKTRCKCMFKYIF